jgi:hypothetical protein
MRSEWTRAERLAFYSLLVAIIGVLVALFFPELRERLGLKSKGVSISSSNQPTNASTPNTPPTSTDESTQKRETRTETKTITVSAKKMWTDTGVQIRKGDYIIIEASGQANASGVATDAAYKWVGPDGWGYAPKFNNGNTGQPMRWVLVLGSESSLGCMTGKIGKYGRPFRVGSYHTFTAKENGTLYLGFNDHISDWQGNIIYSSDEDGVVWEDNDGAFTATIRKQ